MARSARREAAAAAAKWQGRAENVGEPSVSAWGPGSVVAPGGTPGRRKRPEDGPHPLLSTGEKRNSMSGEGTDSREDQAGHRRWCERGEATGSAARNTSGFLVGMNS
jgi:hypothetical protein